MIILKDKTKIKCLKKNIRIYIRGIINLISIHKSNFRRIINREFTTIKLSTNVKNITEKYQNSMEH